MTRAHRLRRPLHAFMAVALVAMLLLVAPPPAAEADTGDLTWSAQDAAGTPVASTYEVTGPGGETRIVDDNGTDDADPRVGVLTLLDQPRGEYTITPNTSEGQVVSPSALAVSLTEAGQSSVDSATFIFADEGEAGSQAPEPTQRPERPEAETLEQAPSGPSTPVASMSETPAPSAEATPTTGAREAAAAARVPEISVLDDAPSIQNVPTGYTTLRVTKGGDRASDGSIEPLPGASFYAIPGHRGTRPTLTANPPAGAVASCTTDASGHCDLVVPDRTGGSSGGNGYWIVEDSDNFVDAQGDEWERLDRFGLGNYNATKTDVPYYFFTGNVAGTTSVHQVPEDSFLYRAVGSLPATSTTIGSHWVNRRANPPAPQQCGVDLALVYDFSTSMSTSNIADLKNAAKAFVGVGGVGGTPSTVDMYKFGTRAQKVNAGDPYNLATTGGQQAARNAIDGIQRDSGTQYTNWDHALRLVAAGGSYDLVVVITDGDPTVSGPTASISDVASNPIVARDLEAAVLSANTVKAGGARVIALGVGMQTRSNLNLEAISGEISEGDLLKRDYFTIDNFSQLQSLLQELATENCGGSLTLTKRVIDGNGNVVTDPDAVEGWTFTAKTPAGNYLIDGTARLGELARTTSDATGAVNFPLDFVNSDNTVATSRTVRFNETQQDGYTLDSVTCSTTSGPLTPDSDGYFNVTVARDAIVSCEVTNKQDAATVQVDKKWVVNRGGTSTTYNHGSQPEGLDATLQLAGQDKAWATVHGPYTIGDSISIGETFSIDHTKLNGCSVDSATISGSGIEGSPSVRDDAVSVTLPGATNTYTITNTVSCQELTLVKQVTNSYGGNKGPADWNGLLHAKPGEGPTLNFDSGDTHLVASGEYVLSESDVAGYEMESLTCAPANALDTDGKTVTVGKGESVTCTIHNKDKPGAVTWHKVGADGESLLGGSQWTLTGPDGQDTVITDCVEGECADLGDQDPTPGVFKLEGLHWGSYTLTETTAPPGYVISESATFQFTVDASNAGTVLTHGDWSFINVQVAGPDLPMTGGFGRDHILMAGAALLLMALTGYGVKRYHNGRSGAAA